MDNCKEFLFENEDTTIVEVLQEKLLKLPEIQFAGYIQKHPLEHNVILKVITTGEDPVEVLKECIRSIIKELKGIGGDF